MSVDDDPGRFVIAEGLSPDIESVNKDQQNLTKEPGIGMHTAEDAKTENWIKSPAYHGMKPLKQHNEHQHCCKQPEQLSPNINASKSSKILEKELEILRKRNERLTKDLERSQVELECQRKSSLTQQEEARQQNKKHEQEKISMHELIKQAALELTKTRQALDQCQKDRIKEASETDDIISEYALQRTSLSKALQLSEQNAKERISELEQKLIECQTRAKTKQTLLKQQVQGLNADLNEARQRISDMAKAQTELIATREEVIELKLTGKRIKEELKAVLKLRT